MPLPCLLSPSASSSHPPLWHQHPLSLLSSSRHHYHLLTLIYLVHLSSLRSFPRRLLCRSSALFPVVSLIRLTAPAGSAYTPAAAPTAINTDETSMSHFYFNQAHQPSVVAHPSYSSTATSTTHHGTRSRRTPRYTPSQAKPIKAMRSVKESSSLAQASAFLKDFEAARSFELEDDELFCPWHLLTEDDVSKRLSSLHSGHRADATYSCNQFILPPQIAPLRLAGLPRPRHFSISYSRRLALLFLLWRIRKCPQHPSSKATLVT